jgi:transcriptional regulator GlxA family with amidase domain
VTRFQVTPGRGTTAPKRIPARSSDTAVAELEAPSLSALIVSTAPTDPKLLRRLLRAKDRMDSASHEEWPVARLARVSGVSEAHFARCFRRAYGVPPHRYLLTRRIERAKALLRDSDLPVTEIAFQTGWNSVGTFGRVFRDITGESPSELRKRESKVPHALDEVPHCFVSAAHRPNLKIAVSEKRRLDGDDIGSSKEKEIP